MATEVKIDQEATEEVEAVAEAEDEEGVAEATDRTTTFTARLLGQMDKIQQQHNPHHSREERASLVLA